MKRNKISNSVLLGGPSEQVVNLLKKCWFSDAAAWGKSICFGLGFFVPFAVWGHDLQEGEMAFSQSRLLCMLLLHAQMISSLKLVLLCKIGQNMTNPPETSSSSTYFPLDKHSSSDWGVRVGREGRQEESATRPLAGPCRLGRWLHRPLTSHSTAEPSPNSRGRYFCH